MDVSGKIIPSEVFHASVTPVFVYNSVCVL